MLILFSIVLFVIDSSDLIDSINLYYRHDQLRNENDPNFWFHLARKRLLERQRSIPLPNRAVKNVILFIGDGMGVSTITAARILKGQLNGRIGEETMLDFDKFPHTALIKTYNVDQQIPDSAATATAFLSGVKNNFNTIGVSAKVKRNDNNCHSVQVNSLESIMNWAIKAGKVAGVVTTTRVTHATPAAAYAHTQNRKWESFINESMIDGRFNNHCKDIARQLIEDFPGNSLSVVLGGGRKGFLPNDIQDQKEVDANNQGKLGERIDGRNLIEEWLENQRLSGLQEHEYAFINSTKGLRRIRMDRIRKLFGLFNYSHMEYDSFRDQSPDGEPSLSEMTETAIRILSKHPNGFLLLVEGGLIDRAHHIGYASISLLETLEFDRSVRKARRMVSKDDSLLIVSADHSQPLIISGYSNRGNRINGLSTKSDQKNRPFSTLMYGTGPGHLDDQQRSELTNDTLRKSLYDLKHQYYSGISTSKSLHTGEDVALYAIGPMAHLFGGTVEQSYIAHVISFASCIGPYHNESHCNDNQTIRGSDSTKYPIPKNPFKFNQVKFFVILISSMIILFILAILILSRMKIQ
ncbi:Alkaline phosphatase [Sarcoptes scabiei]|uniref:Alkaline phosphatase n=1 Tax=Sarcoptes scabiei TaxID=52283 RepID=A0A834RF03_SARSC|nr:Alkaline phosphatase [Sarcoptes scabiei]